MTKQGAKTKGMCIATRCTSVEQFIQMFHRFVDEESFFISTANTRPPGLETSFSVQLSDGTPVLRGLCVVLQAWTTTANPFKTPGVRLGIKRLTANSMTVFEQLLVTRSLSKPPPAPSALAAGTVIPIAKTPFSETAPTKISPSRIELSSRADSELAKGVTTNVLPVAPATEETRTPGSELVLPANPLMNLTDESLEGYVDCTLYEETGTFFPVDEDPEIMVDDALAPPPPLMKPRPAVRRISEPVAIQSAPARFDTSPETEISAPRFETAPVPVVAAPVAPKPVARDSDLAFAQRDSTPTFGESAAVMPLPPVARKRSPWWMIGALVVLAGAGAAVVLTTNIFNNSSSVAAPPPTKPAVAADIVPEPIEKEPVAAKAIEPVDPTPDEREEPPSGEGPPIVGNGPCKLAVATTPAGSMIQLDGKTLAPSPITIAASCEKHQITVSHARYQSVTRPVSLNADKPGSFEVTLNRPTHTVTVTSSPSGATIFINGRSAGRTPTKLNVLGFVTVKLEIKKTGYQSVTEKLYSKVANDKVSVRLAKW